MSTKEAVIKHLSAETGGSFLVRNGGGYVARFSVSYKYEGKDFSKDMVFTRWMFKQLF